MGGGLQPIPGDGVASVHYASLVLGLAVLLFVPFGHRLKSTLLLSEPLLAMAIGIMFGPLCAGWLDPQAWAGSTTNLRAIEVELCRLVIAVQVVNSGTDLPTLFLRRHWPSLITSLTAVMLGMWVVSAALCYAVFSSRISVLQAVLAGACITPTDPVLSAVLLRGRFAETFIPLKVRHLLAFESSANDGLALPFVHLPVLLLLNASAGAAIGTWFWYSWVFCVALSTLIGLLLGAAVALTFNYGMRRKLWDKESQVATLMALALAVTGGTEAAGSDGILAAFCAGLAYGTLQAPELETELMEREHAINAFEILLTFLFFIFFGALLPWGAFTALGAGRLVALAVAVSALRRLPVVMASHAGGLLPVFRTKREAALTGWLGPIGVAAVFWSAWASQALGPADPTNPGEDVYTLCTFCVMCHVVLYSASGPLVGRAYALYEAQFTVGRYPVDNSGDEYIAGEEVAGRTVPTVTEHEQEFGVWPPSTLGRGMDRLRPRLPPQRAVGSSSSSGSSSSGAGRWLPPSLRGAVEGRVPSPVVELADEGGGGGADAATTTTSSIARQKSAASSEEGVLGVGAAGAATSSLLGREEGGVREGSKGSGVNASEQQRRQPSLRKSGTDFTEVAVAVGDGVNGGGHTALCRESHSDPTLTAALSVNGDAATDRADGSVANEHGLDGAPSARSDEKEEGRMQHDTTHM